MRAPRATVAARAEEAQVLPVNTNDFCVASSTSSHAGVSQVFQQTYLLAGMLADQQNLEAIQGWVQMCCELGRCLAWRKEAAAMCHMPEHIWVVPVEQRTGWETSPT